MQTAKVAGLTDDELTALVARLRQLGTDTATVEVKSAAGGLPSTTAETISAFGNAAGGVLVLGLSERDGFRPADGFTATTFQTKATLSWNPTGVIHPPHGSMWRSTCSAEGTAPRVGAGRHLPG